MNYAHGDGESVVVRDHEWNNFSVTSIKNNLLGDLEIISKQRKSALQCMKIELVWTVQSKTLKLALKQNCDNGNQQLEIKYIIQWQKDHIMAVYSERLYVIASEVIIILFY